MDTKDTLIKHFESESLKTL
jgi:rubrerythrin